MKFIVSSQLHPKLTNVRNNDKQNMPIVANVLFTVEGNMLTLPQPIGNTVTQIELSESEGDGSIVIPAKLIVETIKSLADIPVIFTINDDYSIEISAGDGFYNLMGWDADQFPEKSELGNSTAIQISSEHLSNAISKTAFATGSAEMRPVMAGVYCQLFPENIVFVATDAHRLVKYNNKSVKPG